MEALKALEGKKTYLILGVAVILGAIDGYNDHCVRTAECIAFDVPPVVYSILAALGIYTRKIAKPK